MKLPDLRGARVVRASSGVVGVLVAVLAASAVMTQSSASVEPEAGAESSRMAVSPPDRPIPVLASVPAADQLASRSVTPTGKELAEISTVTRYGLPTVAKAAYQRAARRVEQTRPGCDLPWG
ncbi:MAG: hypothetical protein WB471_08765, partial [Nocardioides sp.]